MTVIAMVARRLVMTQGSSLGKTDGTLATFLHLAQPGPLPPRDHVNATAVTHSDDGDGNRPWWRRSPGGPLLAIVGVKIIVTLLADSRYGYHRDELYYAVAGRRLAFGYVDFPPVTPVVARFAEEVFGDSLVGLRIPAARAGIGVVLLTAAMAKQLGGTPRGNGSPCPR